MINDIPTNVIIVFFVLLYIGIKRCFDSVLSLKRLVILPAILIVYSQYSLYESLHYSFYVVLFIIIAAFFGYYIGNSQAKDTSVLADKKQLLVKIPGSFSYLFVFMGLFFYTVSYSLLYR